MITSPILIPTALPPLTLQHSLFLKPPTPLPNSSMMSIATSAIPFGSINHPAKAWWFSEVTNAIVKRQKAFAKAHCSKDCQNYISISRYTSTVISKTKAKSWRKTCSSLFPKTHPSEVFSLLRSISGFPYPTSSDLPNLPSCHTPVDCANHISSHLQSQFST